MKRIFLLFIFAVLFLSFTACGAPTLVNSAKKLEIGMTKKEVIDIMGNDYTTLAARQTPEGALETIKFGFNYIYIVSFMDGKLVEWVYEENFSNQRSQTGNQHNHRNGNPNP